MISQMEEVVKILLDAGALVNIFDRKGYTPLYCAAINNHFDITKLLLDAGADVDKADFGGMTPLHRAAVLGYNNVTKMLLICCQDYLNHM